MAKNMKNSHDFAKKINQNRQTCKLQQKIIAETLEYPRNIE
jgi:hypothetical protein